MNKCPSYMIIDNIRYDINTDFRYAIECDRIAKDKTIGNYERVLGIICTLFGEKALDRPDHYNKLFKGAEKYLLCGEKKQQNNEKPDMDFQKDINLIKTSFFSDYNIRLNDEEIDWWEFHDLMNGLSNSELGNCCVLNRVRNLRNIDTSKIKDVKLKQEIEQQQRYWSLDKEEQIKKFNEKEQKNMNEFYNQVEGR